MITATLPAVMHALAATEAGEPGAADPLWYDGLFNPWQGAVTVAIVWLITMPCSESSLSLRRMCSYRWGSRSRPSWPGRQNRS